MFKTPARPPTRLEAMASIHLEILIEARPDAVWDALRDWGALSTRLVPGFVTSSRVEGQVRVVTFFNGAEVSERIIDVDDDARRLVWTMFDGPYTHHNGAAQVFPAGQSGTRFVWTCDLLPDEQHGADGGHDASGHGDHQGDPRVGLTRPPVRYALAPLLPRYCSPPVDAHSLTRPGSPPRSLRSSLASARSMLTR